MITVYNLITKGEKNMVVYIDILIIENFFVNLFLLLVTMKALRYKYGKSIYFAAIVGAFYTVVLFLQSSILTSLPIKLLVVLLMNLIILT